MTDTIHDQTINLTAGAVEYCYPRTVTETTGKDITGDTVLVSLGTWDAPGTWVGPDLTTRPSTSSVVMRLLIGATLRPAVGHYFLWVKLTDAPEIVPRRTEGKITIT